MSAVEDPLYVPTALFTIGLVAVVGLYILQQLYAIPYLHTQVAADVINSWKVWDTAYMVVVVGLCITAVILAYLTPTSPIFFIVEIILLIVAVFVAPQYSNLYATLANNPTLAGAAQEFPNIAHIIGIMPLITMVLAGIIGIATYGKSAASGLRGM